MLNCADDSAFTEGWCGFRRAPMSMGDLNKVFITVEVEGNATEVAIDTGGVYFICPPDLAELIGLTPDGADDHTEINWRGGIEGNLHRVQLVFPADEGESLTLDVTAFVPEVDEGTWDRPAVLGWHLALEKFRFALDPREDRFYFGPS